MISIVKGFIICEILILLILSLYLVAKVTIQELKKI